MKKFSTKIKLLFKKTAVNLVILFCILSVYLVCFQLETVSAVSGESYEAIYRGNTEHKNVSLMINVYWGTEYVKEMLTILSETGAKATFFVGGCWASANPELLQQILGGGHELANHGYYHKDHKTITEQRNREEIEYNHKLIQTLVGYEMKLFMPPSGSYGLTTLKVAKELGYQTIMWSKDTIDWRDQNQALITTRATKNMQNGDLILMHPTECTVKALRNIISAWQTAGYSLVTVSENIA